MWNDPGAEWRRLSEHYAALYDEELKNLARDPGELTETARLVLAAEMKKRGLGLSVTNDAPDGPLVPRIDRRAALVGNQGGASQLVADEQNRADDRDAPQEYTWKTLLCECETMEQARQLCEALRRAGLDCWLENPGAGDQFGGFNVAYPRVTVAADQLDAARQIASMPIPEDIVQETQEPEKPAEFEAPVCPGCGAPDPALEGVDPFNTWRCEACGRQWTECEPDEPEGGPESA